MSKKILQFLTVLAVIALIISACKPAPTPPPTQPPPTSVPPTKAPPTAVPPTKAPKATPVPPTKAPEAKYKEAPMLAKLVKEGKLPPVEERLPEHPLVLPVYEEIGQYGGVWRRGWTGPHDHNCGTKLVEEHLVAWYAPESGNPKRLELKPWFCEKYEVNDDNTEFTFYLRKGVKWSDGVEVTTEDVRFWYEDLFLNKDITHGIPERYTGSDGKPMTIEIVDKYTFKCKFGAPNGLFLRSLASENSRPNYVMPAFFAPAHYLKKFHPKYISKEEMDKILKEKGVDTWRNLLGRKGKVIFWLLNPDLPVLTAWKVKVPPPADPVVLERNPYYWQVDEEGNQLPYIDEIRFSAFESGEVFNMWLISGQIDMQGRHVNSADYTLYKENEKKGDYRVIEWVSPGTLNVSLNINYPGDEVLRQLFDDARFRHALSVAINREEINDLAFAGLSTPRNTFVSSYSPEFKPEYATHWAEYDPAEANQILDQMGLTERDKDGFRLRPDGQTLMVVLEFGSNSDTAELLKKYWEAVGVKTVLKPEDRSLYDEHCDSGDIQIGLFGGTYLLSSQLEHVIGYCTDNPWAPLYGLWYDSHGEEGIKPPDDHPIWGVWNAVAKAKASKTDADVEKWIQKALDVHMENQWRLGTVGEGRALLIVKNNFRNVPSGLVWDDVERNIRLAQPAQFFFKK